MSTNVLRVAAAIGAAPVLLVWDPSTYDRADRIGRALRSLGYGVHSLPMTTRTLRRLSLVDPTRTRIYRRGGSIIALVGNGHTIARPQQWAQLLERFASAGRLENGSGSGIRCEVLVESRPSRQPELALERKLPFLDLRKSELAPYPATAVRSWSGLTDLELLVGLLYPPLVEGQVSQLLGENHLRRRRGPIQLLDRFGATADITETAARLGFNILELELDVVDPFAVGYIDGVFPELPPAEIDRRWRAIQDVTLEPHAVGVAGLTEDEERRFHGRRPCERKIRIYPIEPVANRAAPVLRLITDLGANGRSVSIRPFWDQSSCLQSIEVVADVESLPPHQRVDLYESLRSIAWLPKGVRITETRARRARPSSGIRITAYRGQVFDLERGHLD